MLLLPHVNAALCRTRSIRAMNIAPDKRRIVTHERSQREYSRCVNCPFGPCFAADGEPERCRGINLQCRGERCCGLIFDRVYPLRALRPLDNFDHNATPGF